jgi:hypothetical protein
VISKNGEASLQDQTHREIVYGRLQFQKRRQLLIGVHNEPVFRPRELIARREAVLETNATRLRSPTALRLLHGDVECGVDGEGELVECAANMDRMASGAERCQHQIDPSIDGE